MKLDEILKKPKKKPPVIMIYGDAGVGKSTLAATAPRPVFLDFENGLANIDGVDHAAEIKNKQQLHAVLDALISEDHDFKTVVVDTIDKAEEVLAEHVCSQHNKTSLASFGYGAGERFLEAEILSLMNKLKVIRDKHNCIIVLLAHSEVRTISQPEIDSYDRHQPRLSKRALAIVERDTDAIFNLAKKIYIDKRRAAGGAERILYSDATPGRLVKNRYKLPEQLPLDIVKILKIMKGEKTNG